MDNLQTLDNEGNPSEERVKDAYSARQMYDAQRLADGPASFDRARIDSAYDDVPPYDQSLLDKNGQSYRVNVSCGFAKGVLDTAASGYADVVTSSSTLFRCPTNYGPKEDRADLEATVEEEVTRGIRSWPDWFQTCQSLWTPYIKHGMGVSIFKDEFNWQWTATGLSDFKFPRDVQIGQSNIEEAYCLRFFSPTDLYKQISDPVTAKEMGWNVEACRRAIQRSVNSDNTAWASYRGYDWERLERELKNNSLFFTSTAGRADLIRVVYMWVKEYDGRVSFYMFCDNVDEQDNVFLFKKIGRYENCYQAYVLFNYGAGTNTYYHSIRGQGHSIFPIHGALNRAYCQLLELATYGSAPTFQPENETAMQEMQFIPTGAYNLITPGITVLKDTVAPNISQGVLPVIQAFGGLFQNKTAQYNTELLLNNNVEKTAAQYQGELGTIAKMSIAQFTLWFDPWNILMREQIRRMKRKDYDASEPGGDIIAGIKKRLLQRGNDGGGPSDRYLQAFYELDVDRLEAVRPVGAGSEAARILAYQQIMGLFNSLPDFGKQNALWDMTSQIVGAGEASRYVTKPGTQENKTSEESIAQLENNALLQGGIIQVIDGQNNLVHARVHLMALAPMLQQAEEGLQVDPMSVAGLLEPINALNQHAADHIARLSSDPMLQQEAGQMRKVLQEADEILHNGILKVQKIQRQQAEQAQEQQGQPQEPQIDPKEIAKIETSYLKRQKDLEIQAEKAHQDLQINKAKADQQLAINDAMSAQKIRNQAIA